MNNGKKTDLRFFVASLLLFSLCLAPAVSRSSDFTLLFTNDVWGEIDPCG